MAESLIAPRIVPDAVSLARAGAERLHAAAVAANRARGEFRLALPGGRTPLGILDVLVRERAWREFPWEATTVFLADERAVPPGDPDRNDALLRTHLLEPLGRGAPRLEPMWDGFVSLEEAAERYARELERPLDLVVLGLGEDGHVASLFPGSPLLEAWRARVAIVRDSPKPPPTRLTLTPQALAEAGAVLALASGEAKAEAVAAVFADLGSVRVTPARLLRGAEWIVDAGAASRLSASR